MTEIYFNEPQYQHVTNQPNGTMRKHVKEMEVNFFGEDWEYMWIKLICDDGTKTESYYMKGTL